MNETTARTGSSLAKGAPALTRRGFLTTTAALSATVALGATGLSACAPASLSATGDMDDTPEETGRWVTHACYFACGGRCVNRSYVQDGKVLRQETDNLHEDSPDYPQQRGCARGRSLRHAVFSPDRLKYPLKRKSWQPGGGENSHGELRGIDEWERISWDEALDYIAQETTRIKEAYGNQAILATGYELRTVVPGLYYAPSLNAYGGCTTTWGQASQGAFPLVSNMMKGSYNLGRLDFSDRFEVRQAKLIVMWGQNPAWSSLGNPTYHYLTAKRAGAKIIFVDPWYNSTMQAIADQWIPVRPGTDTALLLGCAYYMIANDLQDQAFLDTYCLGFDAEHMPENADPKGNFKDYVLGTYDGLPKTPAWASEICGVPADVIEDLAHQMATTKPMTLRSSQAPARTDNGPSFVQAFYTVGWMTGNVGKPGAEVSAGGSAGNMAFGGPSLVTPGAKGCEWPENPICSAPRGGGALAGGKYDPDKFYGIAMAEAWDAVITGEYTDFAHGKKPIDIRMIWKIGDGGRMNQNPDFSRAIEAYRKVEFAVASDMWMTSDCLYSDIVLPASSFWERDGYVMPQTNRDLLIYSQKVIDPLYECREDLDMEAELAKRWGLDPALVKPLSTLQMGFNEIAGATVATTSVDETEPLLTITQEDLDALGVEGTPQQGRVPLDEFLETGVYQVRRTPDDGLGHVQYADYIADPSTNPLPTKSGKFEIYCTSIVEQYDQFGLTKIAPVAQYTPARGGYEDTFQNWDDKTKGVYPLQFISVHFIGRAHQAFDNVGQLRELFPTDAVVNALDAEAAGIEDGGTILVESPYGKILRRAHVTNLVMPGVVVLGQGAWSDVRDDGIDYAGNANTLSKSQLSGEGQCTWNTTTVRIGPWSGEPLAPDYQKPQRIIDEEGR